MSGISGAWEGANPLALASSTYFAVAARDAGLSAVAPLSISVVVEQEMLVLLMKSRVLFPSELGG